MNNIINHLIIWCRGKADVYQRAYNTNGGGFGIGSTLAYELDFKLSTLIDKPFESADALKNDVLDLMDVHYEPGILNPQNRTEQYIIDKVKREFREHLDEVLVNRALSAWKRRRCRSGFGRSGDMRIIPTGFL